MASAKAPAPIDPCSGCRRRFRGILEKETHSHVLASRRVAAVPEALHIADLLNVRPLDLQMTIVILQVLASRGQRVRVLIVASPHMTNPLGMLSTR